MSEVLGNNAQMKFIHRSCQLPVLAVRGPQLIVPGKEIRCKY